MWTKWELVFPDPPAREVWLVGTRRKAFMVVASLLWNSLPQEACCAVSLLERLDALPLLLGFLFHCFKLFYCGVFLYVNMLQASLWQPLGHEKWGRNLTNKKIRIEGSIFMVYNQQQCYNNIEQIWKSKVHRTALLNRNTLFGFNLEVTNRKRGLGNMVQCKHPFSVHY